MSTLTMLHPNGNADDMPSSLLQQQQQQSSFFTHFVLSWAVEDSKKPTDKRKRTWNSTT